VTRECQDRETLVMTFLKCALAAGPVAVGEIEVQARHAGLLALAREITNSKLFRRAKKILGVRSKRVGFGAAGDWFWELPMPAASPVSEPPEQPATKDVRAGDVYVERRSDAEQRCAKCGAEVRLRPFQLPGSKTGGVSRIHDVGDVGTWIEGIAILNPNRPAAGIPLLRWRQFIDDCKEFLDPAKGLAEKALQMDWSTFDLFGCHPSQPLAYLSIGGLLWSVTGGRVIEFHRGWATIDPCLSGCHPHPQHVGCCQAPE
jgi:hypothetical protein